MRRRGYDPSGSRDIYSSYDTVSYRVASPAHPAMNSRTVHPRIENERERTNAFPRRTTITGERGRRKGTRAGKERRRKDVDDAVVGKWRVISEMESGDAGIGMNNGRRAAWIVRRERNARGHVGTSPPMKGRNGERDAARSYARPRSETPLEQVPSTSASSARRMDTRPYRLSRRAGMQRGCSRRSQLRPAHYARRAEPRSRRRRRRRRRRSLLKLS